jgi:hypothetical protein
MDGEFFLKDSVVQKLKANEDIEKLIPADIGNTSITLSIGGNTSVPVAFMDKKDTQMLLDKMEDKVIEGRLPENNKSEVAVHWRILANKKLKVGDSIGSFKDKDEWLNGEYKIVGKLDGPSVLFVGSESFKLKQLKESKEVIKPTGYLILPKEGRMDS